MDLTTITTALSGIKTATDIAKALKGIDASLHNAELKLKIIELLDALVEAKSNVMDVREQLEQKEKEILELKKQKEIEGKIKYVAPYYWIEEGSERDGPFCQNCYDSQSKLIRLQKDGSQGTWRCHTCRSGVKDSSYRSPGPIQFGRG